MSAADNGTSTQGLSIDTRSFDGGDTGDGTGGITPGRRVHSMDDIALIADEEDDHGLSSPDKQQQQSSSYTADHSSRSRSESDEDEEIRLAKEMALAIAQNPNMTPDELKALQEKSRKKVSAAKTVKRAVRSSIKVGYKGVAKGASKVKGAVSSAASAVHTKASGGTGPSTPAGTVSGAAGGGGTPGSRGTPGERLPTIPGSTNTASSPHARSNRKSSADSASSSTAAAAAMIHDEFSSLAGGNVVSNVPSIRMTGIVWKRRSGLGKYSSHAAWERRRIVLQGAQLLYYKTLMDSKDDDASHTSGNDEGHGSDDELMIPGAGTPSGGGGGPMSFLPFRHSSGSTTTNEAARGYIDLQKEQASISATYGHSGAPTPFALSIKVLGQTKWKLCFDTHQELMQWLAAMTDVVVEGSVDLYNAQILEQYDPSQAGGGNYGQLSEPPKGLAASGDISTTDAGGHRLWATSHYNVRSENYPTRLLDDIIPEDDLEDVNSDDEDEDVVVQKQSGSPETQAGGVPANMNFVIDPSTGKDVWGFPADQLFPVLVVLNVALCISRASSISSDIFWHVLTFVNVGLLGVLTKEKVGGEVKPKDTPSSREYVRRLSSGTNLPVVDGPMSSAKSADKRSSISSAKAEVKIPEPSADYKPVAGTTTMKIKNPTDLPVNKDGVIFGGWKSGDASIMNIRSVGYKKHKQKVPSPGEMYECINVDIFESRTRFPDMASRVSLPKVTFEDDKGPKTWNAPDLFVISIAIPTDPPKLYGNTENGGGYTITMYYAMKKDTRDILRRVTADGYDPSSEKKTDDVNTSQVNAVRLLEEWCRRAPTDDAFMARFKVVPNAQNLKEIGLPSWIAKYNGKPFLIKRPGQTGFLYRHPEKSCIEFDISLHPFPYLAKQGICFMKDAYFKKVLVTFGFLIEGRSDDELPECLIGLFQLCYPDPIHAIQGEDFFAGKSPRSF